jgi:hypothetical protein
MVEFKESNYFIGFWFVSGKVKDWLACAYREQGHTNWHLVHRFRYHHSAHTAPFDSKDKKNYFATTADGAKKDEKQIIAEMGQTAKVIGLAFGKTPIFVPIHGDGEKALSRLAMQPWAHIKMRQMTES